MTESAHISSKKILDKEMNAGLKISLLLKLNYPAISF